MHAEDIRRLDKLADLLDSRFVIPGTEIRFGLDTVLGLVPGLGDAVTLLPSAYLIASAHRLGARKRTLVRMAFNTGLDMLVGAVPVLGDLFDLVFKANRRNIALLREDLAARQAASEAMARTDGPGAGYAARSS